MRQRQIHQIEMIVEAVDPISHTSESIGNSAVAMRSKLRLPDGTFADVPVITGDTMRHGLREAGTDAMREAAGITGDLTESALRLLYNGGMVRGSAKDVVSIDEARQLEELMPHLSLLGGCIGNRIVPGKIESGYMYLICEESVAVLPEWVGEWLSEKESIPSSAGEHIEQVQRVKMDALLNPQIRALLSAESASEVEAKLLASDTASARGDAKSKKESKSTMMPFTYETVVRGSWFYWRLNAVTDTDVERDALAVMVAQFFATKKVGGKRGTGHGGIRPIHVRGIEQLVVASRSVDELREYGSTTHAAVARFKAHYADRGLAVRKWLDSVQA